MKRALATNLVMVNWSGVFYSRYELDTRVTALEGQNAAGKTTVLIAAYVALLPDMTRLKFSNVGEQGPTGGDKGLWGRLGEAGAPSYTALEYRLSEGERLVAGVHLQRKSEPTIEPTTFILTGLRDDVMLQDVFLDRGEMDSVPSLPRFRELVARAGGHMESPDSAKDYFLRLFERGVLPLRLATEEERGKFNEMLRATMTGGLSRELTADGLRRFLLREDTGLTDTLTRMRASLDACRVTRLEVEASRTLEREVHGVYEAGEEMFACAIQDSRERASESGRRRDEARDRYDKAVVERAALEKRLQELKDQDARIGARLQETRGLRDAASSQRKVLEQARSIAAAIAGYAQERLGVESRVAAARGEHETAEARATDRQNALREAENRRDAAAEGLVSLQRGLEELARRATDHRLAVDRLEAVRARFPAECRSVADLDQLYENLEGRIQQSEKELAHLERELATAEVRRAEFEAAAKALAKIVGRDVPVAGAFSEARTALDELSEAEQLAGRRDQIAAVVQQCRAQVARQRVVRELAERVIGKGATLATVMEEAQSLDTKVDECGERITRAKLVVSAANDGLKTITPKLDDLERMAARWREVNARASRLATAHAAPIASRDDLVSLRRRLSERRDVLRDDLSSAEARAGGLRKEAADLERGAGARDRKLLEARDAAGAELVADRFEDVPLEDAARIEALLGPLAEALVVDDPRKAAARILEDATDWPRTVLLLERSAASTIGPGGLSGEINRNAAFVENADGRGARLTTIPDVPTLGSRARKKHIATLRDSAKAEESKAGETRSALGAVETGVAEIELVLPDADLLGRPDPEAQQRALVAEKARLEEEVRKQSGQVTTESEWLSRLKARRSEIQSFVADAWLLDRADLVSKLAGLEQQLTSAAKVRDRLKLVGVERGYLRVHLEVLRQPPWSAEEIAAARDRAKKLGESIEGWRRGRLDARWVLEHRAALEWTDAQRAYEDRTQLEPALKTQLEQARSTVTSAQDELKQATTARDHAFKAHSKELGDLRSVDATLQRSRSDLEATGVADTSDEAWDRVVRELDGLETELQRLDGEARALSTQLALTADRNGRAAEAVETTKKAFEDVEKVWRPQQERWERLQKEATALGLLAHALSQRYLVKYEGKGSANIANEARTQALLVIERLSKSSDGVEATTLLRGILDASALGERCIEAWTNVRAWIHRRLPSQIAEEPDPRLALVRLQENLSRLQDKLQRQERELRGDSENVARNIENQKRQARKRITQLNHDLEEATFGSIAGVQIALGRVEHMERVLDALRSGEAQEMLFKPDMPIEQALEDIFRRYGGGQTGGTKLLDYREYLDLRAEIRRKGLDKWEVANAARLSTGEAIGVGASLMMVVLAAWERDAALFRPKRSSGTLRLLFLDEANRLSSDSVTALFELCDGLELQLMLAAPEVAQSQGNTTYHLTRKIDAQGRHEVVVTGRRAVSRPE